MFSLAPVAQWIEYLTSNQSVGSSNLSGGTLILVLSLIVPVSTPSTCFDRRSPLNITQKQIATLRSR